MHRMLYQLQQSMRFRGVEGAKVALCSTMIPYSVLIGLRGVLTMAGDSLFSRGRIR